MAELMYNFFNYDDLVFGGINSSMRIERVPNQNRPARKMDVYSVPGRSGDIVVMQDAWENVEQSYEVWGGDGTNNNATAFGYQLARLFEKDGYNQLSDSYDPNHYRKAYFAGPFDVENELTRRGRATLTFSCDPRRYIVTTIDFVVTVSGTSIDDDSPTWYDCKPQIRIYGSGSGSVTIGGNTINISSITDEMWIDCENEIAYYGTTDLTSTLSGDFPIVPGSKGIPTWAKVYFTGGVTKVLVRPNWWEL